MAEQRRVVFEDPRFAKRRDDERGGTPITVVYEEAPRRGCFRSCLAGCLIVAVILFVLSLIVGFWVVRNWQPLAADVGSFIVKDSLILPELPAAEKVEIGVEVDRLAQAFREGRITTKVAARLVQTLVQSPLATTIIVSVVDAKYIAGSGLSDEEKEAGRKTLARFARGVMDNSIPEASRDATLQMMARKDAAEMWHLKLRVTDDELRAFLAAAKSNADAAQILDVPPVIDPSDELRKIVDEALGGAAAIVPPAPVLPDAVPAIQ